MSEEHDDSQQVGDFIELKEVAPKPKRVYKKSTNPLPPAISPQPSPVSPEPSPVSPEPSTPPKVASTSTPVIKEKKARTQKQIDAFNKMREAYLNKHKTPIIDAGVRNLANEPIPEPIQPVKEPEPVSEPWELGTKKVQKPRAKKNKPVTQEEPQINPVISQPQIDASVRHLANQPTPPPVAIPKVSTAPRFVFV